jgi:hypothetical protein
MSAFEIEHWTDLACAGGEARASIPPALVESGTITVQLDGTDTMVLTVHDAVAAGIADGDVLRSTDPFGVVREHRVHGWTRSLREDGVPVREITAVSPLLDLRDVGVLEVVQAGVPWLDVGGRYTVAEWLSEVIVPWLATKGQTWWALGTDEYANIQYDLVAPATGLTPLELLRALCEQSGGELVLRRDGEIGYLLDVVVSRGATAPVVPVAFGRNLIELQETVDAEETATAIIPLGDTVDGADGPATIAENLWLVTVVDGTTPAWLSLFSGAPVDRPAIAFPGQFVGHFLLRDDGTTHEVLGSTTPDRVQVANGAGFTEGRYVQFVRDASGTRMIEIARPGVRRIARTLSVPRARGEGNLVGRSLSSDWTQWDENPTWPAVGTCEIAQYFAITPADAAGVIKTAVSGSHSSIQTDGWEPATILYPQERVLINGVSVRTVTAYTQADHTGTMTIELNTVSATYSVGQTVVLQRNTANAPSRPVPTLAPDDIGIAASTQMRFLSNPSSTTMPPAVGQGQRRFLGVNVKYVAALSQVNVAAGFCVTNSGSAPDGNWDAGSVATDVLANVVTRRLPGVLLLDITSGTTLLAWNIMQSLLPPTGTVYERVECSAQITSDRRISVGLIPGRAGANANNNIGFQTCRWVMLGLGTTGGAPPVPVSAANTLWDRANRELLARSVRLKHLGITLRDLSAYAGYAISAEQLVLGGRIHLEDLGESPRIVGLIVDTQEPDNPRVVLDNRSVLLTTLLAGVL